jgi:hypothetical protein
MTMKKIISILIALLFLCLMQYNATAQKTAAAPAAKARPAVAATSIRNNIQLKSNGFKVLEAYLLFDDGKAVPAGNKVELNQRVNMALVIDGGWKVIDGMVYPGASEKITLSNGSVILKEDDLFASYDSTGVSAEDARHIVLKAVITQIDNKKNYIIVSFKIWDKKGTASISGSYKFFIK